MDRSELDALLSGGDVAGIVVGLVLFASVAAALAVWRRRSDRRVAAEVAAAEEAAAEAEAAAAEAAAAGPPVEVAKGRPQRQRAPVLKAYYTDDLEQVAV